jgi:hypothetical protein
VQRKPRVPIGFVLGLALALLGLLGAGVSSATVSRSTLVPDEKGTLRVALTGSDTPGCGSEVSPCRTVQYAVDLAQGGDEIHVAEGTYDDIYARPAPPGYNGSSVITQVVYLSKTLTIRGGYTTTDWLIPPDPLAHPTTLDAQNGGRVFFVAGTISPTVEGLRITGGNATALGGHLVGDAGGGLFVQTATLALRDAHVYSNTASAAASGSGGGIHARMATFALGTSVVHSNTASLADYGWGGGLSSSYATVTLTGNTVQSNTASTVDRGFGGGLFLFGGTVTLIGNRFQGNTASPAANGSGGGLGIGSSASTLMGNRIEGNTASLGADGEGGGLLVAGGKTTIAGNTVLHNIASAAGGGSGGGLFLDSTYATVSGNWILSNTATLSSPAVGVGGGLSLLEHGPFNLTNNLVAGNHANTGGSGLWAKGYEHEPIIGRLRHNTLADNRGSGQGVSVGVYTTLDFTNTIIAAHASAGITVTAGSTVTMDSTLWYGNGVDASGEGTAISRTNIYDDPRFADPTSWDYHLGAGSAAIDAGVDAGISTDIDRDPRPIGRPDLGADEWQGGVFLPLVLKGPAP